MKHDAQHVLVRRDDIVVEELAGELLVYDRRTDVAHCLSEVAAVTWRAGERGETVGQAAEQVLAAGLASSADEAQTLVDAAFSELREKELLEPPRVKAGGMPRRQALRRIAGAGAVAFAAPMIVSAAIPSAAAASSRCIAGVAPGGTTTKCPTSGVAGDGKPGDCCSGSHCAFNNYCYTCYSSGHYCYNPSSQQVSCKGSGYDYSWQCCNGVKEIDVYNDCNTKTGTAWVCA